MSRNLILGALGALVVIGAAIYYFLTSVDEIVARAIESNGSAVTGTRVSVSGVSISLREAKGSIRGLRVANPEGFSGDAVSLRHIAITIDPASLVSRDPLVLTAIRVQDPSVNVVLDARGRNNLQVMQDHVKKYRRSGETELENPSNRIRIGELEIGAAKLHADASAIGGKNYDTTLAPVNRSGIGGRSGAPPGEIANLIVRAFVGEMVEAVVRTEAQHQIDTLIEKKLGTGGAGNAAKSIVNGILGN